MTEVCIDKNSIVKIPEITSTVVRPNGEFTISSIDSLVSDYQSQITQSNFQNTPLNRIINSYGSEALYKGTAELNSFLKRPEIISILPRYEEIQNRVATGVFITPIEYADFVTQFLYTPNSFSVVLNTSYEPTIKQLNDFYSGNISFGMNNFCSIAGSVFSAINSFFNLIGDVDLIGLINKIQNLNAAALLNQLKDQIKKVIDKSISRIKDIIEKFNPANIIGQIETFVNTTVIVKIAELKESAMRFFTRENIEKIKSKVEGLINYAVGIFENPDIEEIMFLIQRFCGFIVELENSLNQIKRPLDNFMNNYNNALRVSSSRSLGNTVRAISGGAIRFDSETRKSQINTIRQTYTDTGNPPPINTADIQGVTQWNEGRGDSRIGFGPGLQRGAMGEEGWTRVSPEARIRLMKVQERFGKRLQVNSGYRSPAYNARIGGAKRSQHMSGNAMDISWNGMNIQNREEFIRIAIEEGFRGIGRYGTRFVHVDIGPRREWSG